MCVNLFSEQILHQAWPDFSDWSDKSNSAGNKSLNNFPPAPALVEVTALCESKPCTLTRIQIYRETKVRNSETQKNP